MALCHKWDVKNDFVYVLQFFSLISDSLGSVYDVGPNNQTISRIYGSIFFIEPKIFTTDPDAEDPSQNYVQVE